jgi:NAD(P) transhydrogenase subunit alpha
VRIGIPRETRPGERRVALVPDAVQGLVEAGREVVVEHDAGAAAGYDDAAYEAAGASLAADAKGLYAQADLVCKVGPPTAAELKLLRSGQALVAFLNPLGDAEGMQALAKTGVSALSMELIPRITRAQAMDALSSQATVAGYHAVLLGAVALPRFFPLLMTAAGTVTPARVLVLGAGVAGLQAIATARRLGAVVSAFDVRPVVREQVESLGARFLEIDLPDADTETTGGYAKALSDEAHRLEQELVTAAVGESDVVVTTALIPGRPAPELITAAAVAAMRPGSVIVDLAAEAGGNCALTSPGETVVRDGVTIVGTLNLPSAMPQHASQLYARNVTALLGHLVPEGDVVIDAADEITGAILVCQGGQVVHPRLTGAPTEGAA